MKQESVKQLADGLNVLTASTGVGSSAWGALEYWDFVNTNAAGLGVLLTLVFGIVAIGFNLYNSSKLNQSDKNKANIDEHGNRLDDHIEKTEAGFKNVNNGIESILNKLDKG